VIEALEAQFMRKADDDLDEEQDYEAGRHDDGSYKRGNLSSSGDGES